MKQITIALLALLFLWGCTDSYIDPITPVEPGPDMSPPEITINFPLEGTLIRVTEDVTTINIRFEVKDDIEIDNIVIRLNNNLVASFDEFLDFRRAVKAVEYNNLPNGEHTLSIIATDISGKTTTETVNFEKIEPYRPIYDGEIFYLPFDGDHMELVNIMTPNIVGNPSFVEGVKGRAYQGAPNSYLTFPTDQIINDEFSAVFWYKVDASPDRAGMLVIGAPDLISPNNMNNRRHGFRLFRENAGGNQRVKLNVGNGSGENWFDGGANADINPTTAEWEHVAISISQNTAAVYINGQVVSQGTFPGIDWANCDIMSIASGSPRFVGWGHLADASAIDELRIFNKALSQEEITEIINDERP